MKPVYWKPKYATRRMREQAFVKRQLARENALARRRGSSVFARLRSWLAR